MRFLVTGATSGLGRNATEYLLEKGHEVKATGRNAEAGKELEKAGAGFVGLDLVAASDEELYLLLRDCEVVWHCAALSSPWGDKEEFYRVNVLATKRLARLAGEMNIQRFIHVSTPSVYFDFVSHRDIPETYLAKRFANRYAETKYRAESEIRSLVEEYPQTNYIMLRPRALFGPYDRVIFPRVLSQVKKTGGKLHLPGGGKAYLDLTFVFNAVHALYLASFNNNVASGEIFNITNQEPRQLCAVASKLLTLLDIPFKVVNMPYRMLHALAFCLEKIAFITHKEPALTRYSVGSLYFDMTLSQQKAKEILGYEPVYSIDEGIVLTAEWLKNDRNYSV